MKLLLTIATLLSAAAVSAEESAGAKCKPGTYRCSANHQAWEVCNTSGDWVFAGRCPPGTYCQFNPANGSPYCLPRHSE